MAPDELHALELAVQRLEGKIDTLTEKVEGKVANLDERIAYGDNVTRAEAQIAIGETKRAHERIDAEIAGRAQAMQDAQQKREQMGERIDALERWQSNMIGRLAVWGVLAGILVALVTAILVRYFTALK